MIQKIEIFSANGGPVELERGHVSEGDGTNVLLARDPEFFDGTVPETPGDGSRFGDFLQGHIGGVIMLHNAVGEIVGLVQRENPAMIRQGAEHIGCA